MTDDTKMTRELAGKIAAKAFIGTLGALQGACADLEERYVEMLESSVLEESQPGAWQARIRAVMAMLITRRLGGLVDLTAPVNADDLMAAEEELMLMIRAGEPPRGPVL